jgi:molecular chaperone GrpE
MAALNDLYNYNTSSSKSQEIAIEAVSENASALQTGEKPSAESGSSQASGDDEVSQDQFLRLKAEFDNYRKRIDREKEGLHAILKAKVIFDLLPVLDDLSRMAEFTRGEANHLAAGIQLIQRKMKSILNGEGLEELQPIGKPFDPLHHEALGMVDAGPEQEGIVLEELEKGYLLQGRLLRPSRVRVGMHHE